MTPKKKAKELKELFTFNCRECDNSKISALIAVNEILLIAPMMHMEGFGNLTIREYYKKVKHEIEKL
jgi:hypothetical protein